MSNTTERTPPTAIRRRLTTTQRRQELITAAAELLSARPIDQVSIGEIAQHAGASRALLYHYFASKHDLVRAVVEHETASLRSALEGAGLPSAVDTYLDYIESHPHGYRLLHGGTLSGDDAIRTMIAGSRANIEGIVREHLGISAPDRPTRWALRGWSGFVVAVCLEWIDDDCADRQAVEALIVHSLNQLVLVHR